MFLYMATDYSKQIESADVGIKSFCTSGTYASVGCVRDVDFGLIVDDVQETEYDNCESDYSYTLSADLTLELFNVYNEKLISRILPGAESVDYVANTVTGYVQTIEECRWALGNAGSDCASGTNNVELSKNNPDQTMPTNITVYGSVDSVGPSGDPVLDSAGNIAGDAVTLTAGTDYNVKECLRKISNCETVTRWVVELVSGGAITTEAQDLYVQYDYSTEESTDVSFQTGDKAVKYVSVQLIAKQCDGKFKIITIDKAFFQGRYGIKFLTAKRQSETGVSASFTVAKGTNITISNLSTGELDCSTDTCCNDC